MKNKIFESKAMAIGTALLEWIILFVAAGIAFYISGMFFGAKNSFIIGIIVWLIVRLSIRSILKSILPLKYQDETYVYIHEIYKSQQNVKIEESEANKSIIKAKSDLEGTSILIFICTILAIMLLILWIIMNFVI
jgi:hypothetical protein